MASIQRIGVAEQIAAGARISQPQAAGRVLARGLRSLARPSSMLLLCIFSFSSSGRTMTVGDGGYGRETWTRVLDVVPPDTKLKDVRAGRSRPICAMKRSSSPSDAKTKALGGLVRSRSTSRPPNLRQKAVLGRKTVYVSLAVAIALHRPAAMAVAGGGRRRLGRGHIRGCSTLSSQSRNALPHLPAGAVALLVTGPRFLGSSARWPACFRPRNWP